MIAELSKTTKNTQVDDEVLILPYSVLGLNSWYSISYLISLKPFGGYVKDSRQFKQREKRLLKVVIVNLLLYKQLQY
jgi:hypothetical protein